MNGKGYEKRDRGEDAKWWASVIRLIIFISFAFGFTLGVVTGSYIQGASVSLVPAHALTPPVRRDGSSPSTVPPEGSKPNSGEERSLPNSEGLDSGQGAEESR
jgi:hypothetical protein